MSDRRVPALDQLTQADWLAAMAARHAVRRYLDRPIEAAVREALDAAIAQANAASGLSIQVAYEEPLAFSTGPARAGSFTGVVNYLALVGPAGKTLNESVGYAGEWLVLYAQHLGLNTCWAAGTFNRREARFVAGPGEKLAVVIALGCGESQGEPHQSKPLAELAKVIGGGPLPDWFRAGVEAVQLAPSGYNAQAYVVELAGRAVRFRPHVRSVIAAFARRQFGLRADLDIGIAKRHFELGVDPDAEWSWA